MSTKITQTTTIEASWPIKSITPTIAEWLQIANDLKGLDVPKNLELRICPSMDEHQPHEVKMEKYVSEETPQPKVFRAVPRGAVTQ